MNIIEKHPAFAATDGEGGDFFLRRRRSFRVLSTTLPAPGDELLYCRQLTESHLLAEAHYHHRHGAVLSVEYVESGNILFRNGGDTYALESGELFLFQPDRIAEFLVPEGAECRKRSLQFIGRLLPELLKQSGLDRVAALTAVDVSRFAGFFREFEALLNRHDADEAGENGASSFRCLQFLQSPGARENRPPQLIRLLDCLNTRFAEELSLEIVAKHCHCSPAHLIRLCRAHLGDTPHRLLLSIRMRRAAAALLADESPVKEIAALAGYSSAQNFATEFRKFFGCSPRAYRNNTILN